MDTAQTILAGSEQTQQLQSASTTLLWIAGIAGAVLLTWLIVKATTKH